MFKKVKFVKSASTYVVVMYSFQVNWLQLVATLFIKAAEPHSSFSLQFHSRFLDYFLIYLSSVVSFITFNKK